MKYFNELISFLLLAFIIVVIVVESICYINGIQNKMPMIQKVNIVFEDTASCADTTLYNKSAIDSLMCLVQKHEQLITDKYQYLLEQKEDENRFYSIAAPCVAVILSLFGFFGYKSIKNIQEEAEEKALATAKETAEETAKEISKDSAKEYLENNFMAEVQDNLKTFFNNEYLNQFKDDIDAKINELRSDLEHKLDDTLKQAIDTYKIDSFTNNSLNNKIDRNDVENSSHANDTNDDTLLNTPNFDNLV